MSFIQVGRSPPLRLGAIWCLLVLESESTSLALSSCLESLMSSRLSNSDHPAHTDTGATDSTTTGSSACHTDDVREAVCGVYLFPATTSESSILLINPRIILSGSLTDKLQHYTLLPVPSTTQRPVTPRHPGQQVQSGSAEFGPPYAVPVHTLDRQWRKLRPRI